MTLNLIFSLMSIVSDRFEDEDEHDEEDESAGLALSEQHARAGSTPVLVGH